MTLDLSQIPAHARALLIKDGENFSSNDTLEQANKTLNAFDLHGNKLAPYGFVADDAAELKDARDALIGAGVSRDSKRHSKRIDTAAYQSAVQDGMQVRTRAIAIAASTKRVLLRADKKDAVHKIDTLLKHESEAAGQADLLAKQLDGLQALFSDADIADAAKSRGAPQLVLDLQGIAANLRAVCESKAEPRGTPLETATLDLIDGIIVSLVRAARKASKAASKGLGDPSIATAFELSSLYRPRPKPNAAPET